MSSILSRPQYVNVAVDDHPSQPASQSTTLCAARGEAVGNIFVSLFWYGLELAVVITGGIQIIVIICTGWNNNFEYKIFSELLQSSKSTTYVCFSKLIIID